MRIVIIGCGRIGAHVARSLATEGHDVCVVDTEAASLTRLGESFRGRTVVGPGFDDAVLQQAEVASADAVAVLTNVDATNFMIARAVIELFGVHDVRVRVNDPEFSALYAELGVPTVDLPDLVLHGVRQSLSPRRDSGGPRSAG